MSKLAIHWFRQDLRLADNPSLHFAAQNGPITPIFIHDTVNNSQKEYQFNKYDNMAIKKKNLMTLCQFKAV